MQEPKLNCIYLNDAVESWRSAGFHVDENGCIMLGSVCIKLQQGGSLDDAGFAGFGFENIPETAASLDGLPIIHSVTPPVAPGVSHVNQTIGIDHVVINTSDITRTIKSMEQLGLQCKRVRKDVYPGITQAFFRTNTIFEVVGSNNNGDGINSRVNTPPATFFGLTLVSQDMEGTKRMLGEGLGKVRKAKQGGGRVIGTLRSRKFGISPAVAFISPHKPISSSL